MYGKVTVICVNMLCFVSGMTSTILIIFLFSKYSIIHDLYICDYSIILLCYKYGHIEEMQMFCMSMYYCNVPSCFTVCL